MPLSPEHQRQIAQFMFVVEHYLALAASAQDETTETFGMAKDDFMPGMPLTERREHLIRIGANLSSAAIRLTSIEDVLRDAGVANASYVACRRYFSNADGAGDVRGSTASEWLHVMLRDNAAHEEPSQSPVSVIGQRRRARQDCLEAITFAEAFMRLRQIASSLREALEQTHGMAAFPS